MDDDAHPHRADIVDDYLESEGIARMAWPAYSPDLNPIENLLDALGRAVSSRFSPPATLIELEIAQEEEWRLLDSVVVDHLIQSMVEGPDRPQGVIHQNWDGNGPNRAVTYLMPNATANERRYLALCHDEFRGPRSGLCRSGGISNNILNPSQIKATSKFASDFSPGF
ncbi:transposable element Tcb2 transposase [Trichonephila clavipes]|nr:transposable element Tcb2 transposase [Trichonephila clavipes]